MSTYFDYNATCPVSLKLMERVAEKATDIGNPSAVHGYGRRAKQLIEDTRFAMAAYLNCRAEQIIFTSGGTEANNMALCMAAEVLGRNATILISSIEHPSIIKAAEKILGPRVTWIPVNENGVIDLEFVETHLKAANGRAFICVMYANNETGVIQPIVELVEMGKKYDALIHCDAVQAFGKVPLDFEALGLDMMSLSGHKVGAFPGVGALITRKTLNAHPLICGGGQEKGRRAGTENTLGICSLGLKVQDLRAEVEAMGKIEEFRDLLEMNMKDWDPDLVVFGKNVPRLPNTSMVASPGTKGDVLVITLDLDGIAVSAGSACSSGKTAPSHVLHAMNVADELAGCAMRISMGLGTTEDDIATLFQAWQKNVGRTKEAKVRT